MANRRSIEIAPSTQGSSASLIPFTAFITLLVEDAEEAREALTEVPLISMMGIALAAPGFALLAAYHDLDEDFEITRKRLVEVESAGGPIFRNKAVDIARGFLAIHECDIPGMTTAYESLNASRQTMLLVGSVPVSGDYSLGMLAHGLGNTDDAVTHFEEALEFCTNAGYRPELGWTSFDYAELLIERNEDGDREKVTELQDEAITIATDLGMKPLIARVLAQREILQS